ncbi:ATP-dependent DNA/RNA helicase DHX36-like [Anopheles aquasalis]|uniref:ATP-dependent DNA/RNA helicase DHX36-like n=1 Tax=Anopheles aquasalis TaxID=42839 RepID=UPI00215A46BC|nr:ATP-dependent DNA/RNA helicase DHX36-like [Anopheles aquasalis]
MESESPEPMDESAECKLEIVAEEKCPLESLATLGVTDLDPQRACTSSLARNGEAAEAMAINVDIGSKVMSPPDPSADQPPFKKSGSVLDEDEGYFDENLRKRNKIGKVPAHNFSAVKSPPDQLATTNAKSSPVGCTAKRQSGISNEFSVSSSQISKIRQYWHVGEQQIQNRLEESLKLEYFRSMYGNDDASQTAEAMLRKESLRKVKGINRTAKLDRKLTEKALREKNSTHRLSKFRRKLPAFGLRTEILDKIKQSQVILIKGETGSGKTTQIPQYILEDVSLRGEGSSCRILCTQPRRISAISLAKRVAEERCEPIGQSVGYQVRLNAVKPRNQGGSIMFCTTGIVLAFMLSDPLLREYSHLVLDEIHERDVITDLLLAIIRMVLPYRKDLRAILMSATLTAETFSAYFNNCPMVEIRGITFPVREYYLEDILLELNDDTFDVLKMNPADVVEYFHMISRYLPEIENKYPKKVLNALRRPETECKQHTLLVNLLHHISSSQPEGAILVFLPTIDQITMIHHMIYEHPMLKEIDLVVHMLHSKLSGKEQRQVFVKPPHGTRKIILATNIAESSITIDDVVYVINTGRHMINVMLGNTCGLVEQWISKSNEVQRKGRAGRVQEGICYHLYSRGRMRTFPENVPPEILRIVLDEVIMQIKVLRLGAVRTFMNRLLDKPSDEVIDTSLHLLARMKVIDHDQHLTPLGFQLAQLQMHPTVGKMVLLGCIFGCVDPIASIAATLSYKDAFVKPKNSKEDEKAIGIRKWFSDDTSSDHIMLANVITRWQSERNPQWFCNRNMLNLETLKHLQQDKDVMCQHLYQRQIVASDDCKAPVNNVNAANQDLLNGIIAAGLCTNVVRLTKINGFAYRWCMDKKPVSLDNMSVNAKQSFMQSRYMVYQHLLNFKTNLLICTTTVVNPLALFFFGDNTCAKKKSAKRMEITIGGEFGFSCDLATYRLIEDLRQAFEGLLTRKLALPSPIDWSSEDGALLRAIVELLTNIEQ